jgi:hypothetical protein
MPQSSVTVTPPNPTPPTNYSCVGATPPNPPNYTKNTYNDPKNWGGGTPTSPPPYFDDGAAGALTLFAANTAALASGSAATAGGTENTYPGSGTGNPPPINFLGPVPASTSSPHEGAGTESVLSLTYPPAYVGAAPAPPTVTVGTGPAQPAIPVGGAPFSPNAAHASSLSPVTNAALTSITPGNSTSGVGTTTLGATGTNFTKQSVIYVNGVAQTTTFNGPTSLTAPTVTKKTTAGPWPVTVITGGAVTTAPQTWTFT